VKDQAIRPREVAIGVDSELIDKYASAAYVEHLMKRSDNKDMAQTSGSLYEASTTYTSTARTYASTANSGPKEQSMKINIMSKEEQDAKEKEK